MEEMKMEEMWDALKKDEKYKICFHGKEYIGKFMKYTNFNSYAVFMVDSNVMNIEINQYYMPLFYKIC